MTNALAEGLIEKILSLIDGVAAQTMHKDKGSD